VLVPLEDEQPEAVRVTNFLDVHAFGRQRFPVVAFGGCMTHAGWFPVLVVVQMLPQGWRLGTEESAYAGQRRLARWA
jgi:hypothetical protein